MRITLTGATGRVGQALVAQLRERGDEVTVLSRNPSRARETLGDVQAFEWDLKGGPAPAEALSGRDAVIHLAGEDVAQRWNDDVKREIHASREVGTRNLVAGIAAVDAAARPKVLVSASASGYYGPRGDEQVDETDPAGTDFLADVVVAWEREATRAEEHGLRVVLLRTGIVLDKDGGALEKMLPPFKLGVGGPVAGGRQFMPWIHRDDLVGLYLAAVDHDTWSGPVNASAPTPVTNKAFSKALGRAIHRPAFSPVPGFAVKILFGEMAGIVTTGVNMIPRRALDLGYQFRYPEVESALENALG